MTRHNGQRNPEDIEAAIERTRTDLDETLSQLERSLTPGQLIDQGMDYLRHSSAREYLANLSAASKRDPIPLALVGVGLAWLMMSGRRPTDHDDGFDAGARTSDAGRSAGRHASGGIGDSAANKVQDLTDSARQKAHDLSDSARQTARQLRDSARGQSERLRSGYEQLVNEQPLAVGAVGLAIGAVVAALTPRTQQEERFLGDGSNGDRRDHDGRDDDSREQVGSAYPQSAGSSGQSSPGSSASTPSAADSEVQRGAVPD